MLSHRKQFTKALKHGKLKLALVTTAVENQKSPGKTNTPLTVAQTKR